MTDTDTAQDIHLEVHVCAAHHSYLVTFEGHNAETMALDFIARHDKTHAVWTIEDKPIDPRHERLLDLLFPTCPHGGALWLCAHPTEHYPPDL